MGGIKIVHKCSFGVERTKLFVTVSDHATFAPQCGQDSHGVF